jgi:crotonobetainyl-CoA:carnitine CoA-transferase CaiB-like acyl-CoA transferase
VQNEREWQAFCAEVLLQPEVATDARYATNVARSAARASLREQVEAQFATLSATEVVARLERAQIAHARVNTLREVWAHPQLAARQRWAEVATTGGPVPALLPPAAPAPFPPRMDPVPALGAHTDAILREAGYDARGIARLRDLGAI